MLLGAISYIQFLQLKIQETHKKLFPHASQHGPCTPQSSSAATLELSPLLLSPPPALFEELKIGSWLEDDQDPAALSISLDHSYQSCGESSSNSPQPTKESDLVAEFPKSSLQRPVEVASGPGIRRCMKVYGAKSKAKRQLEYSSTSSDTASSTRSIGTVLIQKPRKFSAVQQFRKKCVNGFIMFCRLNRRPYLSAHPGKASTTATKDLAELWKVMSARERRPYCMKALQFSLLHDRMVKSGSSRFPQENISPLKPVSVLLAEKAAQSQYLGDP
ncbi:meiosis initiator protein [Eleutherodactylus coqui]|uniref:meiosis initiator protein n=1 Tax=Eleutherodactylus coqui TaxID=57060 RepID=UPI003462936D